jgi:predicted DsbA family dithiol-disulfide isomerase
MRAVTIDIISDAICPWCFVGKRRLERALASLPHIDAQIRWRPFFLDPSIPDGGVDKMTSYVAKFGRARVDAMLPMMAKVGAAEGIAFDYGGRISPTLAAHRAAEAAFAAGGAALQDAVVEALFKFYFEQQGDLTEANVVRVAATAGLAPAAAAAAMADPATAESVRREAREWKRRFAISGVPFFVIAGADADAAPATVGGAQDAALLAEAIAAVARGAE